MAASTLAERDTVTVADALATAAEGRRRLHRRRVIGSAVSAGVMVLLVVAAVVGAIAFNNSWWVHHDPKPSADQVAADGSSLFTPAGIDYLTRSGVLNVTMGSTRPAVTALGLPSAATTHVDFIVPIEVRANASRTIHVDLVDAVDVVTSGGRVSAVEITHHGSYPGLITEVQEFAPTAAWSGEQLATFQSELQASRSQHHNTAYSATVGPVTTAGMRISGTLSADATSDPHLVIRLEATR